MNISPDKTVHPKLSITKQFMHIGLLDLYTKTVEFNHISLCLWQRKHFMLLSKQP